MMETRVHAQLRPVGTELLQRKCGCARSSSATAGCQGCKEKEYQLQTKAADHRSVQGPLPAIVHDALRSPGLPLEPSMRTLFETRFGHQFGRISIHDVDPNVDRRTGSESESSYELEADRIGERVLSVAEPSPKGAPANVQQQGTEGSLSSRSGVQTHPRPFDFGQIRIHTDLQAANSARAVNALAYTVGQNIVFGDDQYHPHSSQGRSLIAHELVHTIQQRNAPALQRQAAPAPVCSKTFTKAGNFRQLVDLVRAAETKLIGCGKADVGDRINILRGIYYGTEWSADFRDEKSSVRNRGFQTFTGTLLAPDDPRPCLDCNLFEALQASQDVNDGKRKVDFGHLIIGLDARRSWTARNVPMAPGGASGLALATWVGDLGGGAAMLAKDRVAKPATHARTRFTGSDFGGSINLEGDLAGYLVAPDPSSPSSASAPLVAPGSGIADALEAYLAPAGADTQWNNRCGNFLQMFGGIISKGALTNRATVVSTFAPQIEGFACFYLWNRLRQQAKLNSATLKAASEHITGSAQEVTEIFVDALANCLAKPSTSLAAVTDPAPTPKGSISSFCTSFISGTELIEEGKAKWKQAEKAGSEMIKDIEKGARQWWNDL